MKRQYKKQAQQFREAEAAKNKKDSRIRAETELELEIEAPAITAILADVVHDPQYVLIKIK